MIRAWSDTPLGGGGGVGMGYLPKEIKSSEVGSGGFWGP